VPGTRPPVDLVSAGEAFEDLVFSGLARLPRPGEELRNGRFARTFGGGTLITAVAAARSGARVEVLSALAEAAAERLRTEGVRVRNLLEAGEFHAVSVALSTRADRAFVTFDGINDELETRLLAAFAARLPRTRHLHFALGPRDLAAWARLVERCRERGITTSWDFGWHEALPARRGFSALLGALDWVFVNEREACHYARVRSLSTGVRAWPALARRVVIKQGARGAIALLGGRVLSVAARRVKVVDTTGAGDAFNGGFLAALLAGQSIEACLKAGVRMGSNCVRAVGGLDGLPPPLNRTRRPRGNQR
jgi:sugar/nucleoside kinase (ribokinase family)